MLDAHAGIHLGHDGWFWCFLVLLAALAAIALLDIRVSTRTQLVVGIASVAAIVLLLFIVLAKGGDSGITLVPFDPGRLPSVHALFLGVALAITGFIGFEAAAALGEEAVDPLRVIPRAILIAIAVGIVYYVFLSWVMAVGFGIRHIDQWATTLRRSMASRRAMRERGCRCWSTCRCAFTEATPWWGRTRVRSSPRSI